MMAVEIDDAELPLAQLLRAQVLRMVVAWIAEVEAMQAGGQHPLESVQQLNLSDRGRRSGDRYRRDPDDDDPDMTARGTESRGVARPAVRIRALSPEGRRTERIMRIVARVNPKHSDALQYFANGVAVRDIATKLKRSNGDAQRLIEGGLASFAACILVGVS